MIFAPGIFQHHNPATVVDESTQSVSCVHLMISTALCGWIWCNSDTHELGIVILALFQSWIRCRPNPGGSGLDSTRSLNLYTSLLYPLSSKQFLRQGSFSARMLAAIAAAVWLRALVVYLVFGIRPVLRWLDFDQRCPRAVFSYFSPCFNHRYRTNGRGSYMAQTRSLDLHSPGSPVESLVIQFF